MIRCSATVAADCYGTTNDLYRLSLGSKSFGLCAACRAAAERLGIPVVRVHVAPVRGLGKAA